ncbi:MAG: TatD family hydrolase [Thermotaleaceae bacterium]
MLFDSHAHLDDERFDQDRDEIIKNAQDRGLSYILNPGADFSSSVKAVELAAKYEMVYAAVGVHPHDAKDMDESTLLLLKELTKKPKVMAIGEIGLDFHYDHSPRDIQRQCFREQIQLAREVRLPIIIHDREANDEVFKILKEEKAFEVGVLLHCYSGSAELARQYVKLGAYISIAGPVTYNNARKTVEVVEKISLDHLLIETDSPYLTPVPYRGKRNEPAYVYHVASKIGEIKKTSLEEVANATTINAKKFFGIQ